MNAEEKKELIKKSVEGEGVTRRDALRKLGYIAFASTTMFLLLNNPTKVHAASPGDGDPGDPNDPDPPWDGW